MTLVGDAYLEIPAPKNLLREKSEKAVFQRTLRQRTTQMSRNTVAI